MITKLIHHIRNKFGHRSMVLMYHRVAEPVSDVWDIAVTPALFEEHLQVLKKYKKVVPLKRIISGGQAIPDQSIAITFDDGYEDNFVVAKPLLEKYELPATFFICSDQLNKSGDFWWDELEHLILFSKNLLSQFSLDIAGKKEEFELNEESNLTDDLFKLHCNWKAEELAPVSLRSALYLKLYFLLKPLVNAEQQHIMQQIREVSNFRNPGISVAKSMTLAQLQELASSDLFSIGLHTSTHPALSNHPPALQRREMLDNKIFLEKLTGKSINELSYPFGDYNNDTITVAQELGLNAAFTTQAKLIKSKSHKYKLGRFQVKNWTGKEFEQKLNYWFNREK